MSVDPDDLTLNDLDALYPKRQLSDEFTNRLKAMAVRFTNEVHGGTVFLRAEIEGNPEDFALFVWAHMVTLREGEVSGESQSGGSITRARTAGDLQDALSETRYGRMASGFIRSHQSIGIVQGKSDFR